MVQVETKIIDGKLGFIVPKEMVSKENLKPNQKIDIQIKNVVEK